MEPRAHRLIAGALMLASLLGLAATTLIARSVEAQVSQVADTITVRAYVMSSPEQKGALVTDLLWRYMDFLRGHTENGQPKLPSTRARDLGKARVLTKVLFDTSDPDRFVPRRDRIRDMQLFVKAVALEQPRAPLRNVLGYYLDKKHQEYIAENPDPTMERLRQYNDDRKAHEERARELERRRRALGIPPPGA